MNFLILCVESGRERTAEAEIERLGLVAYYPQMETVVTRHGRKMIRSHAMMPGYLFAGCGGLFPMRPIREAQGGQGWLQVPGSDDPYYITQAGIDRVKAMEASHNRALVDRRTLKAGDRVRIKEGPFANLETLLTSVTGRHVRADVYLFGRTTPLKLNETQVEIITA